MTFTLQLPGDGAHLGAIEAAATGAESGLGVFAFATRRGIELLLDSTEIQNLLARGRFHIIVGTDATTNGSALICLLDRARASGGRLTVEAFLNPSKGTFHPKFSAFSIEGRLTMVIGSGNLTGWGLGHPPHPTEGNWEAFGRQVLHGEEAEDVLAEISRWIDAERAAGRLLQVDDTNVLARGAANSRWRGAVIGGGAQAVQASQAGVAAGMLTVDDEEPAPLSVETAAPGIVADVMVRELSQNREGSRGGLGQADVGKRGLAFLGYTGAPTTALLQHVTLGNIVGSVSAQQLVKSRSKNYRFELAAEAQFVNPKEGGWRIILVAVKMDERTIRYTVVPVESVSHAQLSAILGPLPAIQGNGRRRMRERYMTSAELVDSWRDVPANLLPLARPIYG